MRSSRSVPTVLVVLALVAGGCGQPGGSAGSAAAPDGDWVLTSGTTPAGEVELGDGVEVTLTVDGSSWGGQVCNSYGAQEVEVGRDGSVRVGDVARTEMACLDDRLMTAEDRYLGAFVEVTAYEVTTDQLRLTGDGIDLVYAPVAPDPDAPLVGTVWVLDGLVSGAGPDGSVSTVLGDEATLVLEGEGTILASSGCIERDDGTYELVEARLETAFASDVDYDCGSDELWAQDTHVWTVLGEDPEVQLEGQRLTLTAGDRGLSYAARVPSEAGTPDDGVDADDPNVDADAAATLPALDLPDGWTPVVVGQATSRIPAVHTHR